MNLFVGNLPYRATDQDLRDVFAEYGEVISARVIMDRETGRSRGFGFVEMSSSEEGAQAVEAINGSDWDGRELRVNEARPREPRGGGGGGGGYRRGGGGGGGDRGGYRY